MSDRLAAALLLPLLAGVTACASAEGAPETAETRTEVRSAEAPDASYGRALQDLDARVDRYVYLGSQAGDEAREERRMLGPALEALVAQHEGALVATASDPREDFRRQIAAKSLAFARTPGAVDALVEILRTERDPRLLTNATFALGRIASPATPPEPLFALVGTVDDDVTNNALIALWHVLDARRAAGMSPAAGPEATAALPRMEVALFDVGDPLVRANAAAALGALGDPRSVDPLLNLLRDTHPLVRTQTALALAKLGDRRAIPQLVEAVDQSPSGTPRSAVTTALALLLEKHGHVVPEPYPETTREWRSLVRRVLGG